MGLIHFTGRWAWGPLWQTIPSVSGAVRGRGACREANHECQTGMSSSVCFRCWNTATFSKDLVSLFFRTGIFWTDIALLMPATTCKATFWQTQGQTPPSQGWLSGWLHVQRKWTGAITTRKWSPRRCGGWGLGGGRRRGRGRAKATTPE